jgi:glycosyltransferase involved in cell wall biosynthesis
MKILHVIDELKVGGAQTHLETMLLAAARRYPTFRHRVVGLTEPGAIGDRMRECGVDTTSLSLRGAIRGYRLDRVTAALARVIREEAPDVVEAHLTWSRLCALPAARVAGVPVRIGYEQGDTYFTSLPFRSANFVLQLAAQRIVVCSQALADWAHQTHRIARKRLWVLHNCVDVSRFTARTTGGACGPRWGFGPNATVFVAAGSLGHGVNKRTDVCLRGLASARRRGQDVALVIAGDGPQRQELEQLANELGIAPFVRFLGIRSDVPEVMRGCDAFCHAAPFEPFGIVCVEAMATALPVIVPDQGGMKEAVEPGQTGLIYATLDSEALGAAMAELARDPERRRAFGLAGRQRAEALFSADAYVDTLYRDYAELLSNAGRVNGTPRRDK